MTYNVLMAVMESSRTCPWPQGSSRTISIVLGLGLVGYVLGLVDKVLEFTKDTYTSSAVCFECAAELHNKPNKSKWNVLLVTVRSDNVHT